MQIEKENMWNFEIRYLIKIEMYSISAYLKQFHFELDLFGGLVWFGLNLTAYNQLILIGLYKFYFQFGPGIKFDEQ